MKKPLLSAMRYSVLTVVLAAALPVFANACELRIGSPEIQYGNLQRQDLIETNDRRWELGTRIATIHAECESERMFALRLDAPASQARDTFSFGEHGDVAIQLSDVRIDEVPARLEVDNGLPSRSAVMIPGRAVNVLAEGSPATGRRLTAQVRVNPRIDDRIRSVRDLLVLRLDAELSIVER